MAARGGTYKDYAKRLKETLGRPTSKTYASGRPTSKMHAGGAKNRGLAPRLKKKELHVIEASVGGGRRLVAESAKALAKKAVTRSRAAKRAKRSTALVKVNSPGHARQPAAHQAGKGQPVQSPARRSEPGRGKLVISTKLKNPPKRGAGNRVASDKTRSARYKGDMVVSSGKPSGIPGGKAKAASRAKAAKRKTLMGKEAAERKRLDDKRFRSGRLMEREWDQIR